MKDPLWCNIDVGFKSIPRFTNLFDNSLLDLIIGEESVNLNYYSQSEINPNNFFSLKTQNLSGINVGPKSEPFLSDLYDDGF
ncbi:MAG: hypothetical protein R2764_03770 [Bacteroidales bacterium]